MSNDYEHVRSRMAVEKTGTIEISKPPQYCEDKLERTDSFDS